MFDHNIFLYFSSEKGDIPFQFLEKIGINNSTDKRPQ